MENKRYRDEIDFHERYIKNEAIRARERLFYSGNIQSGLVDTAINYLAPLQGKRLLFLGCGGSVSLFKRFTGLGAQVVALDISLSSVKNIADNIPGENRTNNNFIVMNGETLGIKENSFDIIFGKSIIHHLGNLKDTMKSLSATIKPGGKAVFIEPLGINPLINLYRCLTPRDRTPDERPLTRSDINLVVRNFSNSEISYFYFLALSAYGIRALGWENLFLKVFHLLSRLDRYLFKLPGVGLLAWDVVICCTR